MAYPRPFLARAIQIGSGDPGVPFRPALFLLLASHCGRASHPELTRVGAAIELGCMAAMAHLSVEEESGGSRGKELQPATNWANQMAVLVGDLLLTKACSLCARAGTEVTLRVARTVETVCEGRVSKLEQAKTGERFPDSHPATLAPKNAPLFELPCELAIVLTDPPPAAVESLTRYGRSVGLAFQLAEDALQGVRGGSTLWAAVTGLDQHASLGDARPGRQRAVRPSDSVTNAWAEARRHADRAEAALDDMPNAPLRRTLARLARYAATREVPPRTTLEDAFD